MNRTPGPDSQHVRLQRVMAAAGIASRRQCEQIIREGRVEVDGVTVTELGTKVDPARQRIMVDGQAVRTRRHVYFVLNKPTGVLSTNHDEAGRLRAIDLVESTERIYTVGRLDKSSEGLIIITNDGDLANRLTHPRFGVEKTYSVRVAGRPAPEHLTRLKTGIHLAEGMARCAEVRIKKEMQNCTDLEIVLKEGRNREIRRALSTLGHKVVRLKRIAIGPIRLGELPQGAYRELTPVELASLRKSGAKLSRRKRVQRGIRPVKFSSKSGRYAPRPIRGGGGRGARPGLNRATRSERGRSPRPVRAGQASQRSAPPTRKSSPFGRRQARSNHPSSRRSRRKS